VIQSFRFRFAAPFSIVVSGCGVKSAVPHPSDIVFDCYSVDSTQLAYQVEQNLDLLSQEVAINNVFKNFFSL